MFLPDINFWLALSFEQHLHHPVAKRWFQSSTEPHLFCRVTQQGFLCLATSQHIFAEDTKTLVEAWRMWDEVLSDYRVGFVNEPASLESIWRSYTQQKSFAHKLWNDAYLAAFAKTSDLELVTFDKGFAQFPDLKHHLLSAI
jgi:toxin-antitoxin system PIN domain toxin